MIVAVVFGLLSVFLLSVMIYLADLVLFIRWENKRFLEMKADPSYRILLEEKHKVEKNGRKKNYLLYLLIQAFFVQGEIERGKSLVPFLKNDRLMGIKKEASI